MCEFFWNNQKIKYFKVCTLFNSDINSLIIFLYIFSSIGITKANVLPLPVTASAATSTQ